MGADSPREMMRVEVAYATPEKQALLEVWVPPDCTVAGAIERSGIREEFPGMNLNPDAVGIFSRKASMDQPLQEGDRVEIYRPLLIDPKERRKLRARGKDPSS